MKIRALHPKKNFLNFLVLSLLVIGGSVGVVLATQKNTFDESNAGDVCYQYLDTKCDNNSVYICFGRFNTLTWKFVESCGKNATCSIGGKGGGSKKEPAHCLNNNGGGNIPPSPLPCSNIGACVESKAFCTGNFGTVVSGTCSGTKVCCDFGD